MSFDSKKTLPAAYGFIGAATFWAVAHSGPAIAQIQVLPAFVKLQAATPGTQQVGNSNISGTSIAGQHAGGGTGLTGLNASNIASGTLSSARLPIPLTLSGASTTWIMKGENSSSAFGASAVYGLVTGISTIGVTGETTSTQGIGVYGLATSATGPTTGGQFSSASTDGTGIFASASASTGNTYGVRSQNGSTSGRAVYAVAFASTGTTFGVYGQNGSTSGTGVFGFTTASTGTTYGVYGQSSSTSGHGVLGSATAASGTTTGVEGDSSSTTGRGVYGFASAATGVNYGVLGISSSSSGRGVYGEAGSATGTTYGGRFEVNSDAGRGVYGLATSTTGTSYGVRGQTNSATGFGVFSQGELGASGTKSFRIDHPSDPENKYLLHYASESPYPQNFYCGNVVTDAKGYAWVDLPDYFAEVNTNFKYQLTVIADGAGFAQAVVSRRIQDNRFQVRTSAPRTEVSWEVKADRNDLFVRRKQPKDVVEKEGAERGTYQHPEFYGLPASRGMDYDSNRATAGDTKRPG